MARIEDHSIVQELLELCQDIKGEILQQLTYYKASVYKAENAAVIDTKLEQLNPLAYSPAKKLWINFWILRPVEAMAISTSRLASAY